MRVRNTRNIRGYLLFVDIRCKSHLILMKRIIISCLSLLSILLSCQSEVKFDKVKWQTQEDPAFPPSSRKAMLNDLLSSYKLDQMNKSQVLNLLGQPDYSSDSDIVYKVIEDYVTDIDPVYTKQLEIKLEPDQSVKAVEVNEWKK